MDFNTETGLGACSPMEFLEFRTSEIASASCRLTAALFGGILTTPDSNMWSASNDAPHPLSILACARAHSIARAALNYECKVARAHAKVARAHARVCRGLATPLLTPCMPDLMHPGPAPHRRFQARGIAGQCPVINPATLGYYLQTLRLELDCSWLHASPCMLAMATTRPYLMHTSDKLIFP